MVRKGVLLLSLIIILPLLLSLPISNCILYYPLAPPFSEFQPFYYTCGTGSFTYSYDKNRGLLKAVCSATKNVGSLLNEADLTLIFKGYLISPFSGVIKKLSIKYTLMGKLYVKSVCLPNTYSAEASIGVYVDFMNYRVTLASKSLTLYYSGEDQYVFNDQYISVYQDLDLSVSKGDRLDFSVTMVVRSIATGALEDYAYSLADFYSGSYGLRITLSIGYFESSYIVGSISASKGYVGDPIYLSGRLINSRGSGISNAKINLYMDSTFISSNYTSSDGSFTFLYIIPNNIQYGLRTLRVVFDGDSSYLPSSKDFNLTIPSFSLSSSYSYIRVPLGSVRGVDIYVGDLYGYELPVQVTIGPVPNWLSYSVVGETAGIPPFQFHMDFTPYDVGDCYIEISAIGSDGQSRNIVLNVESYVAPSYSISVNPTFNSILKGSHVLYNVTLTPINGYSGVVTLGVEGIPQNCSYQFSTNPLAINSYERSVILDVYASPSAVEGVYNLIVRGIDGNGLIVDSNTFKLEVKQGQYFNVSIYPTFISILKGEDALFYVNLTSINGFSGYVSLEVLCDASYLNFFKYNFSRNPVYISVSNPVEIVELHVTPSSNLTGVFNFTLHAFSGSYDDSCTFSIEIRQPASIELYYVNWMYGSWHSEYRFLPYEAMGIIINYQPLKKLTLILPKAVFSEFNNSLIPVSTNEDGLCKLIVYLNGVNSPLGSYEVLLSDDSGRIVGRSRFYVDGLKVYYIVNNDYDYNNILFHLTWSLNNESLRFRGGVLELILNSTYGYFKSSPIDDFGNAKFSVPPINFDDSLEFFVYYANSPFIIRSTNSSSSYIVVPFKRIQCDILKFVAKDFSFNINLKFHYSNGDPAHVELLLIVHCNDTVITKLNCTTDEEGGASITFRMPFCRSFVIKLLCRDISNAWVSRLDEFCDLCWSESIGVLSYVNVDGGFVNFTLTSKSSFMDFNCTLNMLFYDEFDELFYSSSTTMTLTHGTIESYPLSLPRRVHKIMFSIYAFGHEVFEGLWVNGDYSWKTL